MGMSATCSDDGVPWGCAANAERRYRFSQETFARTWGNGRGAPIPAVRGPIHSPSLNSYAIGQTAYEYRATAVHY